MTPTSARRSIVGFLDPRPVRWRIVAVLAVLLASTRTGSG